MKVSHFLIKNKICYIVTLSYFLFDSVNVIEGCFEVPFINLTEGSLLCVFLLQL